MRQFRILALIAFITANALSSCSTETAENVVFPPPLTQIPEKTPGQTQEPSATGDTITPPTQTVIIVDTMEVDKTEIEVAYSGGEISFVTTTNQIYTVDATVDWITITDQGRSLTDDYTIKATVAANVGEAREGKIIVTFYDEASTVQEVIVRQHSESESVSFEAGFEILYSNENDVKGVVKVVKPGTIIDLLRDNYFNISSLKIIGNINGDDVYYLRKMVYGALGKLRNLDMYEATIVEGGSSSFTENNKITKNFLRADSSRALDTLILPNSIIEIEDGAFEYFNINVVELGGENLEIGSNAFSNCGLTSVSISDGVKNIGDGAFSHNNITSLNLPKSLKSIDSRAFCFNKLTSLSIPDGVEIIQNQAFYQNNLTSLNLPESLKTIAPQAFCFNKLTSLSIPDGVKTIGDGAFGANHIHELSLGKGVKSIGERAFGESSRELVVYCYAITPPKFRGDYVFTGALENNITFYVPKEGWVKYRIEGIPGVSINSILEMD